MKLWATDETKDGSYVVQEYEVEPFWSYTADDGYYMARLGPRILRKGVNGFETRAEALRLALDKLNLRLQYFQSQVYNMTKELALEETKK